MLYIKSRSSCKFFALFFFVFITLSFNSCKNFLNGHDVFKEIQEAITHENALECSFSVKADSGTGIFVSDGDKTCKVGFDISLQFTLNTDDYVLDHWAILDPNTANELANVIEWTVTSTDDELTRGVYKVNIKFLRQVSNVILKPVCYAIPKAIYINTRDESRADGFTQDTDIIIKFNKPIPEDWFIDEFGNAKNIEIKCNKENILTDIQPEISSRVISPEGKFAYFLQPKLSEDKKTLTISTNKFMHILSNPSKQLNVDPKFKFVDDGYAEIQVILKTKTQESGTATDAVEGEKIPFQDNIEWSYKISNKLDGIPPAVQENSYFYKVGNPNDFNDSDFKGKYPTERLSMAHCDSEYVADKNSYVKDRYFVSKKYDYNSSEKQFCMFFSFTVQDEGGISAVQSTYQISDNTGSMNPDWLNKVDIPSDHLKITKIGDSTYEVRGYIEPENLFDIRKDVEYYNIGLIFKDYSGNASTVSYVTVIASLNTIEKDDIKVWNEFPDIEKMYRGSGELYGYELIQKTVEDSVKKIYVSIPKRALWNGTENTVYSNYSAKVYYGYSYESVKNHSSSVTSKNLIKDTEKCTIDKDVYYFTFDTLDAKKDDYFSVYFTDDYNTGVVIEDITNTYQVPSRYIVALTDYNEQKMEYKLNFPVLDDYTSVDVYKWTIMTACVKETIDENIIKNASPSNKYIYVTANNKNSENGKKLYGMPIILSGDSGNRIDNGLERFILIFDYNGTFDNYISDELLVDLKLYLKDPYKNEDELCLYWNEDGIEELDSDCKYSLSFTNSSGKVETFTEFPFVLKNIGEYTYGNGNTGDGQNITATLSYVKPLKDNPDEYYPDMSITRSIFIGDSDNNQNLLENKKRKFDKVTSNTISLASMTSKFEDNYKNSSEGKTIDVTPPTLNKDRKTLTAFPELIYLNNNYDYGSGFTIIENYNDPNAISGDAYIPLCLTPWKEKWSKLTNYAGTFGNDPGTEGISVSNTITKGVKEIDKLNILIRNNMGTGKYIITTDGGVPDTRGNKQNAALDYLYYQNNYEIDNVSRDEMKSVNYSYSETGTLSVNYACLIPEYYDTDELTIFNTISQAIPLIKDDLSYYWDYNQITESGNALPGTFKNTFVKCGTKYEVEYSSQIGDIIPVYSLPKYYYFDGSKLGKEVGMTNVHQIDDKTVVINSDQEYLVQTYFSKENMSEDIDWELFATVENPKILKGLDFYAAEIYGNPSQDTYYRVIIHWADGTSYYCPVHMIKGTGSPY